MININVEGGTAKLGQNLCTTCSHALVMEMENGGGLIRCERFDRTMKHRVVTCNVYNHRNTALLYEMKEIAWTITSDPKGKIGFAPPKKDKSSPMDDLL